MTKAAARNSWIDNLRSFLTLLVVAHHSSLAYTTFAHFNPAAYITSTHPIVDPIRWKGLDIFEDFNDIFFMSLMFLISGIFIISSLQKKGVGAFVRDRFYRLFIPFVIGVTLLMLLAYYPAYYVAHGKNDLKAYVIDFFTIEAWPVGPPWFIWVLFLFNLVFAVCYPLVRSKVSRLSAFLVLQRQRPVRLFFAWYILTWVVYVPVVLIIDPNAWTGLGPFDFQISRVLLYFSYFLPGVLIGAPGLNNGIFGEGATWIRKWPVWLVACLGTYTILKCSEAPLLRMIDQHELSVLQATLIYRSIWTLSCTFSCIAFLSVFKNLLSRSRWESLSRNAYGIYLVHYIFVVWCQFYLLDYHLPAILKFLITFLVSVFLSWLFTFLISRNKMIGKYL